MIMFINDGLFIISYKKKWLGKFFFLFSTPENYTYPPRTYPYVQQSLLPDDLINLENPTKRNGNAIGDTDDDIFV